MDRNTLFSTRPQAHQLAPRVVACCLLPFICALADARQGFVIPADMLQEKFVALHGESNRLQ